MKRIAVLCAALMALFIVPSVANAHSGTVSCNATGVTFTYNANFATAKTSTEHVGDMTYIFNVTPNVVNTHIVPLPTTSPVVVSATWGGPGSIAPRSLNCPVTPPPLVVPKVVCPVGYVTEDSPNPNMVLCSRVITVTNTVTLPAAPVPPVYYKCPKGTKLVAYKSGATICLKNHVKIKIVTKIKRIYVDVPDDNPPPRGGGVAG